MLASDAVGSVMRLMNKRKRKTQQPCRALYPVRERQNAGSLMNETKKKERG
jgi:hypothetical protein